MSLKFVPLTSNNYSEIIHKASSTELPDVDTLKKYEQKATDETILYKLGVITPEGTSVAFGMLVLGPWDPILKPGYAEINIKVDNDWRNQGIGSRILNKIENFAHTSNAVALQTSIDDTSEKELEWARRKGFNINGQTFESQLDISVFDMSQYNSVFKALKASGISFITFAEYPQDKDSYNRFWDFWWELVSDVPGMEEKPRPDNDRMSNLTKDFDKKGFILAVDGEQWVAMSMIVKETDAVCYNSMTGVDRQYRGRGLAQAIKVKAIEYALKNNVKYVRTNNDSKNVPMLTVNEKLGYKQKPGKFSLIKQFN